MAAWLGSESKYQHWSRRAHWINHNKTTSFLASLVLSGSRITANSTQTKSVIGLLLKPDFVIDKVLG